MTELLEHEIHAAPMPSRITARRLVDRLQNEGFTAGDEAELQKGNSMGITIVNSTGDTGVAECAVVHDLVEAAIAELHVQ